MVITVTDKGLHIDLTGTDAMALDGYIHRARDEKVEASDFIVDLHAELCKKTVLWAYGDNSEKMEAPE